GGIPAAVIATEGEPGFGQRAVGGCVRYPAKAFRMMKGAHDGLARTIHLQIGLIPRGLAYHERAPREIRTHHWIGQFPGHISVAAPKSQRRSVRYEVEGLLFTLVCAGIVLRIDDAGRGLGARFPWRCLARALRTRQSERVFAKAAHIETAVGGCEDSQPR